jgi:hypothetical protein
MPVYVERPAPHCGAQREEQSGAVLPVADLSDSLANSEAVVQKSRQGTLDIERASECDLRGPEIGHLAANLQSRHECQKHSLSNTLSASAH